MARVTVTYRELHVTWRIGGPRADEAAIELVRWIDGEFTRRGGCWLPLRGRQDLPHVVATEIEGDDLAWFPAAATEVRASLDVGLTEAAADLTLVGLADEKVFGQLATDQP